MALKYLLELLQYFKLCLQVFDTLHSIFSYGNNHGFRIHSVDATQFKIIWKSYHSKITLILFDTIKPVDREVYFSKLDLLFNAIVIFYGVEDLLNIADVETFKNDIKVCLFSTRCRMLSVCGCILETFSLS